MAESPGSVNPGMSDAAGSAMATVVSRRQCLLAALPEFLLGLQFLAAHWHLYLPGTGPGLLPPLLQTEILVLMATLGMGSIGLVMPRDAEQARGRLVLFWGTFGFFFLIAFGTDWSVAAGYLAMLLAGNVGMLLAWRTPTAGMQLVARCVVAFYVFMVSAGVAGMPERMEDWHASTATWHAGTLYFFSMATLEASGLFLLTVPRLGARVRREHWGDFAKLPEQMRELFAVTGRHSTWLFSWLEGHRKPARRR